MNERKLRLRRKKKTNEKQKLKKNISLWDEKNPKFSVFVYACFVAFIFVLFVCVVCARLCVLCVLCVFKCVLCVLECRAKNALYQPFRVTRK